MKKRLLFKLLTLAAVLTTLQASAAMYIVGDTPFGGWDLESPAQMTDNGNGTYSYSGIISGTVYFVFGDGRANDWETFGANYRYGPNANGNNEEVSPNNWVTTQRSNSGAYVFSGSGSSYTVTFDKTNMRFKIEEGLYSFQQNGIYYLVTSYNTVSVTKGSTYGMDYEGDIDIPSSVTHAGVTYQVTGIFNKAFQSCHDLTSINIPTSVTSIGNSAFYYCTSLTQVVIPESVQTIGDWNFYHSDNLTTVILPSTLQSMGSDCFGSCPNISRVTCRATTPPTLGNYCFSTVYTTKPTLYVPEGSVSAYQADTKWTAFFNPITAMPDYDFSQISLKFVITGGHTAKVVGCVLSPDNTQGSWGIPNEVTYQGVTYLVTEVGARAFYGYNKITTVYIGSNIKTIGIYAFYNCTALKNLSLANVEIIAGSAFGNTTSLQTVVLPNSLTCINNYAFEYSGLTSVTIPSSVKIIDANPFLGCQSLTDITVQNSNEKFTSVNGVLFNKSMTSLLAYPIGNSASSYIVPEGVTQIGINAFGGGNILQKVTLPSSLTEVHYYAFSECPSLTNVTCLAETPPAIYELPSISTFAATVYQNAGLRVPYSSHEAYRNHAIWGQFNNIVSEEVINPIIAGDVTNDGHVTISDVTALINLLLTGMADNNPAADVNGDNIKNISDVTTLINKLLTGTAESGSSSGEARSNYLINSIPFSMVKVAGGTFMMGEENDDLATPVHQVTVSDYCIGETEVTQVLWTTIMKSNPSYNQNHIYLPVENIDWNACQEFTSRLSQLTGQNFRLPTEAEWEFAARGGNKSEGYIYAGSNNLGQVAWYKNNSGNKSHIVATKAPNELGLYDMSGNVFEWCQDYWGSYSSAAQIDPQGPSSGDGRVCRSSAFNRDTNGHDWFKCGGRTYDFPGSPADDTGLRLARDAR